MIGLTIIGATVGLMIGVVELLARDAWLQMVEGPLAGKEFLIFKDRVHVGASPRSDIYLFNDDQVADRHAVIRAAADQYEIEAGDETHPLLLNGRAVSRSRLRHGDQITLGSTVFVFQRRRTD
jgi:pSer/pThr/pTyr-binding forkhead associated (FHA) protein